MKSLKYLLLAGFCTSTVAFAQTPPAPPLPPAAPINPVQPSRPGINPTPVTGFNSAPVNGFSQQPVNGFTTPPQILTPVVPPTGPGVTPQFNGNPVTGYNGIPVSGFRTNPAGIPTLPAPVTVPQPNVVAEPAPVNNLNPGAVTPAFTNPVAAPLTNLTDPQVVAPSPF